MRSLRRGVPKLAADDVAAELPAWSLSPDGVHIRREWTLADFRAAIKLANSIGAFAERERHFISSLVA